MHTQSNDKLKQLQSQLEDLKNIFEDLISRETEFDKLKPVRTQIKALENAIADALKETSGPHSRSVS